MKKTKKALAFAAALIFLFAVFSVTAFAYENEKEESDAAFGFVEDFSQIIPPESGVEISEDELMESIGFEGILASVLGGIRGEKPELISFFLMVLGFAVLCAICDTLSFSSGPLERTAGVGVLVVMSLSVYPKLYSIFQTVTESLESVNSFFGTALPVLTAITAASGSVKTAGVQAMNMNIALGIAGGLAVKVLLPLSSSLLALALISSFGDGGVASVSRGIKHMFTVGLGIITAVSSAAIALQTVIASASDSAALRAARYAAGGLIPVVGSSVSSALSTLAGGLAYAKSTVGVASISVILALSLTPLILLLLYRMVFGVAVLFLEYVDIPRGVRCFSAYKTALDSLIAVYVMSIIVCIIQLIVFMKGGASAA